jgi:hypothetical protein
MASKNFLGIFSSSAMVEIFKGVPSPKCFASETSALMAYFDFLESISKLKTNIRKRNNP